MVVLGEKNTIPVTLEQMIHHCRAVAAGVSGSLVVGDMPFGSYNNEQEALTNATRLIKEGGADVVKLEGGARVAKIVQTLTDAGIAVMGHIGLTPQTFISLGGFRCQGKTESQAQKIIADALALQEAGCFSIVAECVPEELALRLTKSVQVPTIGIGSGNKTSGQVLVWHDMLGLSSHRPRFAKMFGNVGELMKTALLSYKSEVLSGLFPSPAQTVYLNKQTPAVLEEQKNFEGVDVPKHWKVVVMGGGALGSLITGHLSSVLDNPVHQYSQWTDHVSAVKEKGLHLKKRDGSVDIITNIVSGDSLPLENADLVILCVKSNQTEKAMTVAKKLMGSKGYLLSLQNGWNIDTICSHVSSSRVLIGVTSHGAEMNAPGEVFHRGEGNTFISSLDSNEISTTEFTKSVAALLSKAGFLTSIHSDATQMVWQKLMISSVINPLTSILQTRNGELGSLPIKELISPIAKEVSSVFQSVYGRPLTLNPEVDVMSVVEKTSGNISSMLADKLHHRQSEIESILGYVCSVAQSHQIRTPMCNTLLYLVRSMEKAQNENLLVIKQQNSTKKIISKPKTQVCETASDIRKWRTSITGTVGFVPTMGCLHEGHLSLVREAKKHYDHVVVSIFVNPSQFAPHEDFDKYPRTLQNDLNLLETVGVDAVFTPTKSVMYPNSNPANPHFKPENGTIMVEPIGISTATLEGQARPHFFAGVATVCTKLFCVVTPDGVFFGQKDFVQTVVISLLVKDLLFPIKVHVCDTSRETDGLAMSSRNRYLSTEQRAAAPVVYRALQKGKNEIENSRKNISNQHKFCDMTVADARKVVIEELQKEPLLDTIEYVSFAESHTAYELKENDKINIIPNSVCLSLAVFLKGSQRVRLIDNILI
eukprot:c20715_g1_i1.p1 GENE.c20715_g1_i1~~c20715_g1_i1.p1  ORF type:complete len:877 (+),score=401.62 c20715_g1_i1:55-2685(+)